ncbi:MAG TPA: hypothetical protein VMI54_28605 [Polyangiaceae bacterium]|nr:hypothetical protein [Polyangiaceae bacterium]
MLFVAEPRRRQVLGFLVGLAVFGCKTKAKPAAAAPPPSASATSAQVSEAPADHCRALGSGSSLIVGEVDRPARAPGAEPDPTDDTDDDEAALPFATRVDSALALETEFAAGGLTTHGGKTEAFVAFVPLDGGPGRRVGLGAVHGDVDPPLVTGNGRRLLVATSDMDAGGGMLRVAAIEHGADKPHGEFSLTSVEHDAGAAFAEGEQGALLVWGAHGKHGVALKALALDPEKLGAAATAGQELKGTGDAESPALVARPGGYWLSWVAEQAPSDGGAHVDASARADAGASDDLDRLVDVGPRVLMTLALDTAGKAVGGARPVSGPRSHVVGFSSALLPDGALSLVWREDDATPGVEGGPPVLARVGLDGSVERAKVDDEELSAGMPSLLADPKPGGDVWMALESASDGTRVGVVSPAGLKLDSLIGDRLLRGADLLAAGDKKLFVAKARGKAVELSVLECKP